MRRLGLLLLGVAVVAAVALGAQGLHAPWENGFKGANGGAYAMRFLQQHFALGLGVTLGGNVVGVDPHAHQPIFYLNHPATYTLLHLLPAALFGLSEATMRIVALLLWLPAIPALWWIARRLLGEPAGGLAALLLACTPMTAYYGPMANTDGALLAASLGVAAAFLARVERPTRGNGALLVVALFYAVLLDWSAIWLVPLLAVLSFATADSRRARELALRVTLLALVPTALLFAHTAVLCGGLGQGATTWAGFLSFSQGYQPGRGSLPAVVAHDALALYRPPLLLLAALGLLLAWLSPRAWGLRRGALAAVALALPGALHVLAFRGHARVHDYWSIASTPGLVLAAVLGVAAAQRAAAEWTGGRRSAARGALVLLVATCGWAAIDGVRTTHGRTEASATTFFRDLGDVVNRWFGPDDVVATSVGPSAADAYARAALVGPVDTLPKLRALRHSFSRPAFTGQLAFLLPLREKDTPLAHALREIVEPEPVTNGLLFRLQR